MEPSEERTHLHWSKPLPRHLPAPSFWPAGLAFSLALLLVGPALQYTVAWLFLSAGGVLFLIALGGWLREVRADISNEDEEGNRD